MDYWITLDYDVEPLHRTVPIVDGRFALEFPASLQAFDVGRIVIDDREAYCNYASWGCPPEEEARLQAGWLPAASLRVYEDGGSLELDQLEVRQGSTTDVMGDMNLEPPVGAACIAACARSPIPLTPLRYNTQDFGAWSSTQRWFVRAPGTTWGYVDVDHAVGGDYRLELGGAARLCVNVSGTAVEDAIELCVARVGNDRNPIHQTVITGAATHGRFDHLREGTYAVTSLIRTANSTFRGREALVDVREGAVALVDLDMRAIIELAALPVQSAEKMRVAIQAEIPPCWRGHKKTSKGGLHSVVKGTPPDEPASIELEFEMKKTRAGLRSVAVAMLEPGSWKLAIDGIPWSHEFKVDAQTRNVPVSVPPLVELPIVCQDADSGAAIGDVALFWGRAATHHEFFSNCATASIPERNEALKLLVAQGSVAIHSRKSGYSPKTLLIDTQSVAAPVVVSLERSCGIKLRFLDGVFPVYTPYALQTTLREIGGTGQILARCSDQLVQQIEVTHPGMYEIKVSGLDPLYLQPDPIRVVVERGKFTDVSVSLLTQ
ncbi:MAG: hypothetical protein ABI054_09970 [Planctomycetota bacterium]